MLTFDTFALRVLKNCPTGKDNGKIIGAANMRKLLRFHKDSKVLLFPDSDLCFLTSFQYGI